MTCSAVKTLYGRCVRSKLGECVSGALTRRKFYQGRQSWRVPIIPSARLTEKVGMMELIVAVALLAVIVVYLRKAEPVAHAIVNEAPRGDGCALLSAFAVGLPAIVILLVMVALASMVGGGA